MHTALMNAAARHLLNARTSKSSGPRLPEECRPSDNDVALLIQRRVGELLGYEIGGWKCGLPREGKTIAAPLYRPAIHESSPCPVIPENKRVRIEPEIAFVLSRDLQPREGAHTETELRECISETRLVLEILGSRYSAAKDFTFPELLADGLLNQGLFAGPRLSVRPDQLLGQIPIRIGWGDMVQIDREGLHPDGHPFRSFSWFVEFCRARGEILRAGQLITTGSYVGAVDVPLEMPIDIEYVGLGCIRVEFTEER